jgi:hypothetical protein
MWTQLRTGILGAVLGGLAIGGVTMLKDREPSPRPATDQMPVPMAEVPGYVGPLYDHEGRMVGYALPEDTRARQVQPASRTAPAPAPAAAPGRQGRSTGKSIAIVGGSAGTGAAIGALAGGGKGAAIGAISGGAAGLVYDRHTHKKPR